MKLNNIVRIAICSLTMTTFGGVALAEGDAMGGNPGIVQQDSQQIKEVNKEIKDLKAKKRELKKKRRQDRRAERKEKREEKK